MFIKFKNNEKLFFATAPIESKLFDTAKKETGWLFGATLTIDGNVASDQIDALLTPEAISEMTIYNNEKSENKVINGYQKVQLATIKHTDDLSALVDVQFTKWTGTDNK